MAEETLNFISDCNAIRHPTHVAKEYYDAIRNLIAACLLLKGYAAQGEGAHKELIESLPLHYPTFTQKELVFIDELRIIRNRIAYDGFFVTRDYLERRILPFNEVILKLRAIIAQLMRSSASPE